MKSLHLFWIIPLCIIFAFIMAFVMFCFGTTEEHNNRVPLETYKNELQVHWACMDGCSNMQEILFDYDYYNETMKKLHDNCTNICYEQYMVIYNDG